MSDEVRAVLTTGKVLRIGDAEWTVVDDQNVPIACPDFIVDTRNINGNLHLAMAMTRAEGGTLEAIVCTRVRIDLVFAQILRNTLDEYIKDMTTAPKKQKGKAN